MSDSENKPSFGPITEAVARILQDGSIAILITMIEAPEDVGAKLLVEESGTITGSLGDHNIDAVVVNQAMKFLDSKEETRAFHVREFAPELLEWSNAQLLFERIQPEPRIVICGAGHVGASLAKLAILMGCRSTLIDDRAEFLTREHFPDERIELIVAESWAEAVRAAIGNGAGVSVAVVTRGHNEDEECMQAIMTTTADYIGLIGSKRRTNIVLQRLREKGAPEEQLRKVRAPIGLDIGAVTPEEVALAIFAEIVAERRGGSGESLSRWRRAERGEQGKKGTGE